MASKAKSISSDSTVQFSLKIVPYPRSWVRRISWRCCTRGCLRRSPPRSAPSRGKPSASSPAWAAAGKTPRRTEASQRHTLLVQIREIYDFCQFIVCFVYPYPDLRNFIEKVQYFIIFNYHYPPVFDNIFLYNTVQHLFCRP